MKRDVCAMEKPRIGFEMLAYLADHPNSGDTLEGIVQWWLLERRIEHGIAKVREALAELVSKGLVVEYRGRNSQTHYRINKSKYEEIETLIKRRSGDTRFG